MAIFVNFIAFQIGWFSAVLSAAAGQPWVGALIVAAVVTLHVARAEKPRAEFALVIGCGVIGGIWDSLLVAAGWVTYPSGMLLPFAAPYWIVAMWMSFATTLNVSLGWMKNRPLLAAVFGLFGGPLAYYTGEKLGGIILADPVAALAALGVGWAVMMPLLLGLADRLDSEPGEAASRRGWILD